MFMVVRVGVAARAGERPVTQPGGELTVVELIDRVAPIGSDEFRDDARNTKQKDAISPGRRDRSGAFRAAAARRAVAASSCTYSHGARPKAARSAKTRTSGRSSSPTQDPAAAAGDHDVGAAAAFRYGVGHDVGRDLCDR